MLSHPILKYHKIENQKPIWGYLFLGLVAYLIFKKENADEVLLLENPSRKTRYWDMLSGLNDIIQFVVNKLIEKGVVTEAWREGSIMGASEIVLKQALSSIVNRFHSEDQIVELLKRLRAAWYFEEISKHEDHFLDELKENKKLFSLYNRIKREAKSYESRGVDVYEINHVAQFWRSNEIKHFFDLARANNIEKILLSDVSNFQNATDYKLELGRIEHDWLERGREKEGFELSEGETFIDCGNGYKWIYLAKASCEKEAEAMRHCGNQGGADNDRILSLREFKRVGKKEVVAPHLTFIAKEYNAPSNDLSIKYYYILEEMKGFANNKPSEKYHAQIMDLVLDERILFLMGGGYKPQNNFHLTDLSDKNLEIVKKQKPWFFDPKLFINDSMTSKLETLINAIFDKDFKITKEGKSYIIDRYDNFEAFFKTINHLEYVDLEAKRGRHYSSIEEEYDKIKDDDWLFEAVDDHVSYSAEYDIEELISNLDHSYKGRKILKWIDKILHQYDESIKNIVNIYKNGELGRQSPDLWDYINQAIRDGYSAGTYASFKSSFAHAIDGLHWGAGLFINLTDEDLDKPMDIRIDEKNMGFWINAVLRGGVGDYEKPFTAGGGDEENYYHLEHIDYEYELDLELDLEYATANFIDSVWPHVKKGEML